MPVKDGEGPVQECVTKDAMYPEGYFSPEQGRLCEEQCSSAAELWGCCRCWLCAWCCEAQAGQRTLGFYGLFLLILVAALLRYDLKKKICLFGCARS